MRQSLLIALSLLSAPMAGAETMVLNGIVVEEAELDRTLVSKPGWLRGVHFRGNALSESLRPQMSAVLPNDWAGAVACARITSMVGSYSALVKFELPSDMPEDRSATFTFPLEGDQIKTLSPETGGITLERGECVGDTGKTPERQYVANLWNQDGLKLKDGGEAELAMHLNIARADEIVAVARIETSDSEEKLETVVACKKLDDPSALAFNYSCTVAVPAERLSTEQDTKLHFSYQRLYRGRSSQPRNAVIFLGVSQ